MSMIRFSTFRRVLLGLIIAMSSVSIGLSIRILPLFSHKKVFWMIISIQGACLCRALWSILRKSLLKHHHSVASETIALFFLLPFELVLALVTSTSPLERERTSERAPVILQILILINTIINLSYTTCLLFTALITCAAFDSDIWLRDIDSSPSPFPVSIIVVYVFPCLARWCSSSTNQDLAEEQPSVCLPGCQCTIKPSLRTEGSLNDVSAGSTQHRSLAAVPPTATSLSRSLIRLPNAVERRVSIAVAFEV